MSPDVMLAPHAAAALPEPWAVLTAADTGGMHWASNAAGFEARPRDARTLELRGEFPAGLVRFDLEGRAGAFDAGSLTLKLRFGAGHGPHPHDEAAPPTGPWDYINGDFVVPRFGLEVDGIAHPECVWLDLPGAADLEAGRARSSFALRFSSSGPRTIALAFARPRSDDMRLDCATWASIRIGRDERDDSLRSGVDLLPEMRGVHPRMWLTAADAERLRQEIGSGGIREAWWRRFLGSEAASAPLGLALRALLARDSKAREAALAVGDALCDAEHWGTGQPGHMGCDNDIRAGEHLFLLSLLCDWLRPEGARAARWRAKLIHHARLVFRFALLQRSYLPTGYLQNHFSATYMGLGAAGLLGCDDADLKEEAQDWLNFAANEFRRRNALWTPDGSGCGLDVSYGLDFHVRFAEAIRSACGLDVLDGPHYRALPDYWLHRLIPSGLGGYRGILWVLARRTEHAALQAHLARAVRESATLSAEELIWGDPRYAAPMELPLTRIFEDSGEAYLHAEPQGRRAHETWLSFQAGVPFGKTHNARLTRYNFAHFMPSRGEVLLRHRGRTILGDGGRSYRKLTSLHDVLTFDETGQFGDGFVWMPKPRAEQCGTLGHAAEAGRATALEAELSGAYPRVRGLERYTRRVLFLRDEVAPLAVIVDRVRFGAEADARTLHWRFHAPEAEVLNEPIRAARIGEGEERFLLRALAPGAESLRETCGQTEVVVQYTWRGAFQRQVAWSWPRDGAREALGLFVLFPEAHAWRVEALEEGWRLSSARAVLNLDLADAGMALSLRDSTYSWRV
ncbi:MAG: hypothetical protein AMXMBFR7_46000 [Planctomycetota bacterium]